tara:strand:- start:68 stop:1660 length:1593 start_codon:yes stop_codon:yes gene_type:complete
MTFTQPPIGWKPETHGLLPDDRPDEGKLGYEFWEGVGNLPIIKQIKEYNETTAQQSEYLAERARSGKSGLLVQGLQAINDAAGTVVGAPFQALDILMESASDATNIDKRTLGAIKDIFIYGKSIKVPKTGKFYQNVQTAKRNISRQDIFNPGQVTVKPQQVVDEVFSLSRTKKPQIPMVTTGHKDLVLSAEQLGLQGVPGFTGETYALQSTIRRGKNESEDDYANRYFDDLFNQYGLTKDAKLNLRGMLDSGSITKHYRKLVKMGIGNPNYSLQSFKNTRRALVEEFLFGLEHLGLDPNKIEAHHIASLRQVASLFEGLDRNEFPEMLDLIWNEGIFTGNDPRNLVAIQKKAHYNKKDNPNIYAVHTYLNEKLGLYGEKIVGDFGVEVRDLSPQERLPYIKRFAAVVKGSQPIIDKAIRDVLDLDHLEDSPEAAAMASLDISEYEAELIKDKVDDYLKLQLTEPNYEALLDSIFGGESAGEAMRRRGIKPGQPVQSQLFDLGKVKPPRKITKKDNEYPSGPGAYWDIESE